MFAFIPTDRTREKPQVTKKREIRGSFLKQKYYSEKLPINHSTLQLSTELVKYFSTKSQPRRRSIILNSELWLKPFLNLLSIRKRKWKHNPFTYPVTRVKSPDFARHFVQSCQTTFLSRTLP